MATKIGAVDLDYTLRNFQYWIAPYRNDGSALALSAAHDLGFLTVQTVNGVSHLIDLRRMHTRTMPDEVEIAIEIRSGGTSIPTPEDGYPSYATSMRTYLRRPATGTGIFEVNRFSSSGSFHTDITRGTFTTTGSRLQTFYAPWHLRFEWLDADGNTLMGKDAADRPVQKVFPQEIRYPDLIRTNLRFGIAPPSVEAFPSLEGGGVLYIYARYIGDFTGLDQVCVSLFYE